MSLLIDENLSFRLKRLLADVFPACVHVADFGLLTAGDAAIYARARSEGLALLSKDDDFRERVERVGPPPKLVRQARKRLHNGDRRCDHLTERRHYGFPCGAGDGRLHDRAG